MRQSPELGFQALLTLSSYIGPEPREAFTLGCKDSIIKGGWERRLRLFLSPTRIMESSFSPLDAEQGVYVGPPALSPSDLFRPFDVWDPVDPVEPVSTLSADVSTGGLIETADFYSPTRDPTLDSCIDGDMFSWIPTDEIPPPPIAYQQLGRSQFTPSFTHLTNRPSQQVHPR